MTVSKLLTLSADGATATVANATMSDILTSLIDPNKALTGMYKFAQTALVGLGTAAVVNKRHSGEYFNFGGR